MECIDYIVTGVTMNNNGFVDYIINGVELTVFNNETVGMSPDNLAKAVGVNIKELNKLLKALNDPDKLQGLSFYLREKRKGITRFFVGQSDLLSHETCEMLLEYYGRMSGLPRLWDYKEIEGYGSLTHWVKCKVGLYPSNGGNDFTLYKAEGLEFYFNRETGAYALDDTTLKSLCGVSPPTLVKYLRILNEDPNALIPHAPYPILNTPRIYYQYETSLKTYTLINVVICEVLIKFFAFHNGCHRHAKVAKNSYTKYIDNVEKGLLGWMIKHTPQVKVFNSKDYDRRTVVRKARVSKELGVKTIQPISVGGVNYYLTEDCRDSGVDIDGFIKLTGGKSPNTKGYLLSIINGLGNLDNEKVPVSLRELMGNPYLEDYVTPAGLKIIRSEVMMKLLQYYLNLVRVETRSKLREKYAEMFELGAHRWICKITGAVENGLTINIPDKIIETDTLTLQLDRALIECATQLIRSKKQRLSPNIYPLTVEHLIEVGLEMALESTDPLTNKKLARRVKQTRVAL